MGMQRTLRRRAGVERDPGARLSRWHDVTAPTAVPVGELARGFVKVSTPGRGGCVRMVVAGSRDVCQSFTVAQRAAGEADECWVCPCGTGAACDSVLGSEAGEKGCGDSGG